MIDVVVCYSILEKCKSVDAFSGDAEDVKMILGLRQHRMVFSDQLLEYFEEYFQAKSPEWQEWFRIFCTDMFYTKERARIVTPVNSKTYIKGNAYLNELVTICKETEDKIILIEPKRRIDLKYVRNLGISVFDSTDMNDASGGNRYSMYTLPVNGKYIPEGEDSKAIADWMGRFLWEEDYIQIFDSYLLTNEGIKYLKKYILKYVKEGTYINIYSLLNEEYSTQQIIDIFIGADFEEWKFSIFLVKNKKDLHARSIQGSKYIIQLDRGLSVFGRDGKTFQTTISVFKNQGVPRIVLRESQLEQIV